jgi:hypothetical protein
MALGDGIRRKIAAIPQRSEHSSATHSSRSATTPHSNTRTESRSGTSKTVTPPCYDTNRPVVQLLTPALRFTHICSATSSNLQREFVTAGTEARM